MPTSLCIHSAVPDPHTSSSKRNSTDTEAESRYKLLGWRPSWAEMQWNDQHRIDDP